LALGWAVFCTNILSQAQPTQISICQKCACGEQDITSTYEQRTTLSVGANYGLAFGEEIELLGMLKMFFPPSVIREQKHQQAEFVWKNMDTVLSANPKISVGQHGLLLTVFFDDLGRIIQLKYPENAHTQSRYVKDYTVLYFGQTQSVKTVLSIDSTKTVGTRYAFRIKYDTIRFFYDERERLIERAHLSKYEPKTSLLDVYFERSIYAYDSLGRLSTQTDYATPNPSEVPSANRFLTLDWIGTKAPYGALGAVYYYKQKDTFCTYRFGLSREWDKPAAKISYRDGNTSMPTTEFRLEYQPNQPNQPHKLSTVSYHSLNPTYRTNIYTYSDNRLLKNILYECGNSSRKDFVFIRYK
jgi:hypothetical protein